MTWKPVTTEQYELFEQIMLWIRTARDAGLKYNRVGYGADWLPTHADFAKSALFERIRSGLPPLDEPPPVGFSCPWYALVEDAGPHYVFDVHHSNSHGDETVIVAAQNVFKIYERLGEKEYIVGDIRGTSYRFRLWFDPDWYNRGSTLPIEDRPRGGWFMQNVALASGMEARSAKTVGLGPKGDSPISEAETPKRSSHDTK